MTSNQKSLPSSPSSLSRRWDSLRPPTNRMTTKATTDGAVRRLCGSDLSGIYDDDDDDNEDDLNLSRGNHHQDRPDLTHGIGIGRGRGRGRGRGWEGGRVRETSTQSHRGRGNLDHHHYHHDRQYGLNQLHHHHHHHQQKKNKQERRQNQKSSQRIPTSSISVQQDILGWKTTITPELFLSSLESRLDKIAAMAMSSAEEVNCVTSSCSSSSSSFLDLESNEQLESWILSSLKTLSVPLSTDQVVNITDNLSGRIGNLGSDLDLELQQHTTVQLTDHDKTTNRATTTTMKMAVMMTMTRALACIVRTQKDKLSGEHTAQTVVGEIFLPFLEGKYDDIDSATYTHDDDMMIKYQCHYIQSLKTISQTMKCLLSMNGNKSHVSAILCPLTEGFDQNDDGKEVLFPNPLRIRLLRALSSDLMLHKVDSDHRGDGQNGRNDDCYTNDLYLYQLQQLIVVSELLALTLEAVRKIDDPGLSGSASINNQLRHGSTTNMNTTSGLNDIKVQQFLINILGGADANVGCSSHHRRDQSVLEERQRLRISTFCVLKEIIAFHPTYLSRLGWKLLVETDFEYTSPPSATSSSMGDIGNSNCFFCRQKPTLRSPSVDGDLSYLLLAIHSFVDSLDSQENYTIDESILSIECLSGLLEMMPWNAWIGRPLKADNRMRVSRTVIQPQQSSMNRRVVESLERIGCVLCCTHTKWIQMDGNVIRHADKRAAHVWTVLLGAFFREVPFVDSSADLNGVAQSLWGNIASAALGQPKGISIDVMLSSLGGSVTPSGSLQGACIPARSWLLQTAAGSGYLSRIIREMFTNQNGQLKNEHVILEAILRSVPDVAIQHWEELDGLFRAQARSSEVNGNTVNLRLMKALSIGRNDFGFEVQLPEGIPDNFLELVCVVVRVDKTSASASTQEQRLTLDILASLDGQDWKWFKHNKPVILRHYSQMMLECTKSSNAGVREDSCKALGKLCSTYLPHGLSSSDESYFRQTQNVSLLISDSMISLLEDKKASVRSMALHVLGNLAVSLRESNQTSMINNYLIELSRKTLRAIEDSNTKVKVNAIRSLGHVGFLVGQNYGIDIQMIPLLCDMTLSLTSILKDSIDIMSSVDIYQSFTSKQRIAARKYGWGACNSLGHIFRCYSLQACCSSVDAKLLENSISSSFLVCMECLMNSEKVNNKVFHAAVKAIIGIDKELLFEINKATGIVGDALIVSIGILFQITTEFSANRSIEPPDGIDSLLIHLLSCASTNDILTVLKSKELDERGAMGDLYTWMIDQPTITAHTFRKVSNAFQQLDDDPKLGNGNTISASDSMLKHMFLSRASMIEKQSKDLSPDDENDENEL